MAENVSLRDDLKIQVAKVTALEVQDKDLRSKLDDRFKQVVNLEVQVAGILEWSGRVTTHLQQNTIAPLPPSLTPDRPSAPTRPTSPPIAPVNLPTSAPIHDVQGTSTAHDVDEDQQMDKCPSDPHTAPPLSSSHIPGFGGVDGTYGPFTKPGECSPMQAPPISFSTLPPATHTTFFNPPVIVAPHVSAPPGVPIPPAAQAERVATVRSSPLASDHQSLFYQRLMADPDAAKQVRDLIGQPSWSGKPEDWVEFFDEWPEYWESSGLEVAHKGRALVTCFKRDIDKKFYLNKIKKEKWNFDQVKAHIDNECLTLTPENHDRELWKKVHCKGTYLRPYMTYWSEFQAAANKVDDRTVPEIKRRFKAGLVQNMQRLVIQFEAKEGVQPIEKLDERLRSKLLISHREHHLEQQNVAARKSREPIKRASDDTSKGKTPCGFCGIPGHTVDKCRKKQAKERSQSAPPPRSGLPSSIAFLCKKYNVTFSDEKIQQLLKDQKCFFCQQAGHKSKDCSKKGNRSDGKGKGGDGKRKSWVVGEETPSEKKTDPPPNDGN
jgi:hypothetical protein